MALTPLLYSGSASARGGRAGSTIAADAIHISHFGEVVAMRTYTGAAGAGRRKFVLSVAISLAVVCLFGSSVPARALSCGETVGPSDNVQVLNENLECEESPALIIEGPVVVNLRGHTIACTLTQNGDAQDQNGVMTGTGIEVTGSLAEIRNGKIKDCVKGVLVEGDGSHRVERLAVTSSPGASGNGPIGFQVQSDHNLFIRNIVRQYAGEGFRLESNFNVLKRNKAIKNGDHGFQARPGANNVFLWNEAIRNEGDGFRSRDGGQNRLVRNTAKGNRDAGIQIRASNENLVIGNIMEANGVDPCAGEDIDAGIAIRDGSNNRIRGNKTQENCIGIKVQEGSLSNRIIGNLSLKSTSRDMVDDNFDCDDNTWFRNIFRTSTAPPDDLCVR